MELISTYSNVGTYEEAWDQMLDPSHSWALAIEEAITKAVFGSLRVHNPRGYDIAVAITQTTQVNPTAPENEATVTLLRERLKGVSVTVFSGLWVPGPEAKVAHVVTLTNYSEVVAPVFISLSGWVSTVTWNKVR